MNYREFRSLVGEMRAAQRAARQGVGLNYNDALARMQEAEARVDAELEAHERFEGARQGDLFGQEDGGPYA
jgi:hypothetical protein